MRRYSKPSGKFYAKKNHFSSIDEEVLTTDMEYLDDAQVSWDAKVHQRKPVDDSRDTKKE